MLTLRKHLEFFFSVNNSVSYNSTNLQHLIAIVMSSIIRPFPVPGLLWYDWAIIYSGLAIGVGSIFEILRISAGGKNEKRVYTWTNFWLLMSGVIHVRQPVSVSSRNSTKYSLIHLLLFILFSVGSTTTWHAAEITPSYNPLWICMHQQVEYRLVYYD